MEEHTVPNREARCSSHPATPKRHDPEKCAAVFGKTIMPKQGRWRPVAGNWSRKPGRRKRRWFDSFTFRQIARECAKHFSGSAHKDGWCRRGAVNAVPFAGRKFDSLHFPPCGPSSTVEFRSATPKARFRLPASAPNSARKADLVTAPV